MISSTMLSTNLFILVLLNSLAAGSYSTTFTIVNRCSITVYPGIFHAAGTSLPSTTTGFTLQSGESKVLTMPDSMSGNLWGRSYCSGESNHRNFSCRTGDCASSIMECNGGYASAPATIVEFSLNAKSNGVDYFSVSVVNGYNLPIIVEPLVGNGIGDCLTTGCTVHMNETCPSELRVMRERDLIGCRSACQPFSKYCNSEFFKKACPHATVHGTETFQSVCASTDYVITFCPTNTSLDKPVENSGGRKKKGSTNNNKLKKGLLAILAWLKKHKRATIVGGAAATVIASGIIITCVIKCGCCKCDCCNSCSCCPRERKRKGKLVSEA